MAKAVRAEVLSQLRCPVADIRIGVSASGQGRDHLHHAAVCGRQHHHDLFRNAPVGRQHGPRHPGGRPESAHAPKATQEYKLRAMARNYTDRHSWDHLDSDCVMAAADEIRALRAALASAPVSGEEVTDEMVQAGAKAAREYFERTGGNAPAVIYRAMLRPLLPPRPAPSTCARSATTHLPPVSSAPAEMQRKPSNRRRSSRRALMPVVSTTTGGQGRIPHCRFRSAVCRRLLVVLPFIIHFRSPPNLMTNKMASNACAIPPAPSRTL